MNDNQTSRQVLNTGLSEKGRPVTTDYDSQKPQKMYK